MVNTVEIDLGMNKTLYIWDSGDIELYDAFNLYEHDRIYLYREVARKLYDALKTEFTPDTDSKEH